MNILIGRTGSHGHELIYFSFVDVLSLASTKTNKQTNKQTNNNKNNNFVCDYIPVKNTAGSWLGRDWAGGWFPLAVTGCAYSDVFVVGVILIESKLS